MRSYLFIVLLTAIASWEPSAAQAAGPQRATAAQVKHWIDQLDHDDFAVREAAAAQLSHAGRLAIPPLAEGVASANPEVAWRSSETLERMAMEGDEATMNSVVAVLCQLAAKDKPGLTEFAMQMRQRQIVFRHQRAAGEILKLGGQVSGGGIGLDGGADAMMDMGFDMPAVAAVEGFILEAPLMEPDFAVEEEEIELAPPAALPAIAGRVVEALLPGRIGAALRRAIQDDAAPDDAAPADAAPAEEAVAVDELIVDAIADEPPAEPADPLAAIPRPLAEEPADFRIPALEELPAEAPGPAGKIAEVEAVPVEAADIVFAAVGAPVFFGGGMMMPFDGGSAPGYVILNSNWHGGDAGLQHLKDLSGITNLQLEGASLSDAALKHIAQVKSLSYLQIRGGKFSLEGLRDFHRQRPKVSIMAMGEGLMGVMGSFTADSCTLDTVIDGSAAQEAGLRPGDKITAIAGDPIRDFSDLTISVSTRKPGEKLKIAFERGGEPQEIEMTLKPRQPGQ